MRCILYLFYLIFETRTRFRADQGGYRHWGQVNNRSKPTAIWLRGETSGARQDNSSPPPPLRQPRLLMATAARTLGADAPVSQDQRSPSAGVRASISAFNGSARRARREGNGRQRAEVVNGTELRNSPIFLEAVVSTKKWKKKPKPKQILQGRKGHPAPKTSL